MSTTPGWSPRPQSRQQRTAEGEPESVRRRVRDLEAREAALIERLETEHQRALQLAELAHAKSEFLNLAAHELRGPITVLAGYLSLLEDGAFGPPPSEFAAIFPVVNARLVEMESLINAMLESARLEDGRLELNIERVDLREIVDDALTRSQLFAAPGQRIALHCPEQRILVDVDRARTNVVVGNLLVNALKYSVDRTDVRCDVSVAGEAARVVVADQGIGIEAEDVNKLFIRFGKIRRDPSSRWIPGIGLGLYLARELARAHGGDVTVESEAGAGSTFTLHLPLAAETGGPLRA